MKKTLLFFFLLAGLLLYAQEETSESSGDTAGEQKENDIYRIFKDTENTTRLNKIGVFKMETGKVTVYTEGGKYSTTLKEVTIDIVKGFVKDILVITKDGKKFSNSVSISLVKYPERQEDKLYNVESKGPNKEEFVKLGDVLKYCREPGNNFFPDDVKITLPEVKKVQVKSRNLIVYNEKGKQKLKKEDLSNDEVYRDSLIYVKTITLDDGISNLVDYRIYSDFLGLIESTPNGIVNFEARANLPLNVSNMRNTNLYVFKSINPYVRYSRFDKEDRVIQTDSVILNSVTNYSIKNKIQLIQKSYLSCGFSVDLLTWNPKNSFVEFNIPFQNYFYLGEAIQGVNQYITSVSYGGGLEMKINRSRSFGINSAFYVNSFRHLYNRNNNIKKVDPYSYFVVDSEVFFYGKSKKDAFFLRFNYTSVFGDSNNFFQFQLGYKSEFKF